MLSSGAFVPGPWCSGRLCQRSHLRGGEPAPGTRWQGRVGEGSHAGAHEPSDGMTDRFAHAPDLSIAPFMDGDPQDPWSQDADPGRSSRAVGEEHAVAELAQGTARWDAVDFDEILLFDPCGGVRQGERQVAVVGEHEESFAVDIETTDGEHRWFVGDEGNHGRSTLRVDASGDHTPRLVEQVVHEPRCARYDDAVHREPLARRVDALAETGGLAVDGHPTLGHQ